MSKIDDGGPAFPQWAPTIGIISGDVEVHEPITPSGMHPITTPPAVEFIGSGMSLRDWFAGQAISGFTANDTTEACEAESLAKWSYEIADAMLAARKQEVQS